MQVKNRKHQKVFLLKTKLYIYKSLQKIWDFSSSELSVRNQVLTHLGIEEKAFKVRRPSFSIIQWRFKPATGKFKQPEKEYKKHLTS